MSELDVRKMHETCLDCENDYLRKNNVVNVCRSCVYNVLRTKVENEAQNKKSQESSED